MTNEVDCAICADFENLRALRGRHDRDCSGCQARGSPNASDIDDSDEEDLVAREGGETVRRPKVDYTALRKKTPVETARIFFGLDDEDGDLSLEMLRGLLEGKLGTKHASKGYLELARRHHNVLEGHINERDDSRGGGVSDGGDGERSEEK
ncbi:hypothetical protein E2P81_ATG00195 [Venturia nashicola]|uniref:Uncharacterized protein n=1 Tax=Venturia nashicola TaxID=86259 RepID=A0A4Z1PFR8_9PEZI|nr:hypothetical protein E6O75_ATG00203 [Venturia nashicola]TLD39208.1 hypothetical protein E2P81_ATG00195 [Venturia nashicola]